LREGNRGRPHFAKKGPSFELGIPSLKGKRGKKEKEELFLSKRKGTSVFSKGEAPRERGLSPKTPFEKKKKDYVCF